MSLAPYRHAAAGFRLDSDGFRLRSASCGKCVSRHLADRPLAGGKFLVLYASAAITFACVGETDSVVRGGGASRERLSATEHARLPLFVRNQYPRGYVCDLLSGYRQTSAGKTLLAWLGRRASTPNPLEHRLIRHQPAWLISGWRDQVLAGLQSYIHHLE